MIIIAGPCGAESKKQTEDSLKEAKKRSLRFLRIPLWKPRTKPGFDGLGKDGLEFLLSAKKEGIIPATEVVTPEHAKLVIETIPDSEVLLWIGARNQNHFLQNEIAKITAQNKDAFLLIKNQPWPSKDHFLGIIEHVKKAGISKERLLLCHRGFFPTQENPDNYRNIPDYEMAMEIKKETDLPMLIDPSHIGGSVSSVFKVIEKSKEYAFDGMMIEVHPTPKQALTDRTQQLSWEEFDFLLKDLQ